MRHPPFRKASFAVIGALLAAAAPRGEAAEPPPAANGLSAEDWRVDLEFARAQMPVRHANLFHTITPEQFGAAFDRLTADLDRLAEHEVIVRLAEIVAAVGDGHSRLTLPMDPGAGFFSGHTGTVAARVATFRQLPLRLARTGEGYLVTATDPRHAGLLGSRVVDIDGRPIAEADSAVAPVVNRDNDHQLADLLPWFMVVPEVLNARGVSPSMERSRWRFVDSSGRVHARELQPVARGVETQWQVLPAPDWPGGPPEGASPKLWFADIDRPSAVYVRVAEIADQPETSFAAFAASLQAHLAVTSHRRLILDLRGNPGGDNSLNAPLVRSLVRTPWVSDPAALFVLIDGGTFSAAMNLVEDLEHWLPAVFVGSGTGARPNSYGDARKLELPRSGLTIRLSSLYWQNHPNDNRAAIEPLIPAQPTLDDLRAPRDPVAVALASLDEVPATLTGTWRGMLFVEFRHVSVELIIPGSAAGQGSLSIRDLGVDAAEMHVVEMSGSMLRGTVQRRSTELAIAARAGGDRLTGWIDYRGQRYPMVLARQATD
jgi:hypothetical protein